MTRPQRSMDGFIPRRTGAPLGGNRSSGIPAANRPSLHGLRRTPARTPEPAQAPALQRSSVATGLTKADIEESLKSIEDGPPAERRRRTWRIRGGKRILKWALIALLVAGLVIGGYVGYNALNFSSVFQGNLLSFAQRSPLKQDANGRSNVLIFGTSEDSPDHNAAGGAGGPLLTDSIMVLSVNQEKKDAFMVSIPRDLWVQFDEPCSVGYQEKINSVYQCGSNFGENPEAGAAALQKKVGEILGLDIQYYGHIDYSVVKQAVDAVGGVEVTIESNPPGMGILDRNFDWKCNYQCHYVKYEDGETVHLDGEHALALARARNAQGGYGLAGGNFDREKNQQKILRALREKAMSVGTLANAGKVSELLNAMGDNLRTNVEKSEVQTIIGLATEVSSEAIESLNLYDEESPLVKTGPVGSVSAVYPVMGMFDYSRIQAYIAKAGSSSPVAKEGAVVAVLNGSGVAGAAQRESDWLEEQELIVGQVANAPSGDYKTTQIYQRGEGMDATRAKLESLYGVTVQDNTPAPVNGNVDFVVIIGENNPAR